MNAAAPARLEDGLRQLRLEPAAAIAAKLLEYGELLIAGNQHTNLVGATDVDGLVAPHLLDSLAPLAGLKLADPIVDVGSGGGLPGIAAAIAWPKKRFVLLEPRAKRAHFLTEVVKVLGLANVAVEQMTAETAGRSTWRGQAGTALVRALAKPAVALELALPLLRRGGTLVFYQGRAKHPTPSEMEVAELLGGRLAKAQRVSVPYLDAQRHVWIIRKSAETPAGLPRRSGTPARQPLAGKLPGVV